MFVFIFRVFGIYIFFFWGMVWFLGFLVSCSLCFRAVSSFMGFRWVWISFCLYFIYRLFLAFLVVSGFVRI